MRQILVLSDRYWNNLLQVINTCRSLKDWEFVPPMLAKRAPEHSRLTAYSAHLTSLKVFIVPENLLGMKSL